MAMNFGSALELLRGGRFIAREGWNGKGMHLYLEDGYALVPGTPAERRYEPVIVMFTAHGKHQRGWNASQADMLADDWCELTTT